MKRVLLIGLFAGALLLALFIADRSRAPRTVASPVSTTTAPSPVISNAGLPGTNAAPSAIAAAKPAPVTQTIPTPATQPAAFAAFNSWADLRLAGDASADAARGEALAWQRREAMLELIERDPATALAQAAPFSWRRALPLNVTRHFEVWLDTRGEFEVAMAESLSGGEDIVYRWVVIDGKRYEAFVHGRRVAQKSQRNVPLHGKSAFFETLRCRPKSFQLMRSMFFGVCARRSQSNQRNFRCSHLLKMNWSRSFYF